MEDPVTPSNTLHYKIDVLSHILYYKRDVLSGSNGEDQWVKWLRINFQKTLNYLELLFYNLAGFEPNAEMESVLDWAEDPEAERYKLKFVQSWSCEERSNHPSEDDPVRNLGIGNPVGLLTGVAISEISNGDDWDELEDDGVMVDPSYGWHRLNDPVVYDPLQPKIEDRLSPSALPLYNKIHSLSGNALAFYGRVLYRLWAEWKDGKRNSFKQRDWDELWAAYKFRKSAVLSHETAVS
jgi:hypothetical protein